MTLKVILPDYITRAEQVEVQKLSTHVGSVNVDIENRRLITQFGGGATGDTATAIIILRG